MKVLIYPQTHIGDPDPQVECSENGIAWAGAAAARTSTIEIFKL
jgi:hypothetical protein